MTFINSIVQTEEPSYTDTIVEVDQFDNTNKVYIEIDGLNATVSSDFSYKD